VGGDPAGRHGLSAAFGVPRRSRGVGTTALCKGWTGRWTDRFEDATAWVLLAAALLVVLFGIGVHDRLVDQARSRRVGPHDGDRHLAERFTDSRVRLNPQHAAVDGSDLEGPIRRSPHGLDAGRTVQIWIDRAGARVPEPISDSDALAMATVTAAVTFLAGASVLGALWGAVRRITLSYNCAAWEREWREVAVIWSRGEGRR
jgi:hypothetical protein